MNVVYRVSIVCDYHDAPGWSHDQYFASRFDAVNYLENEQLYQEWGTELTHDVDGQIDGFQGRNSDDDILWARIEQIIVY